MAESTSYPFARERTIILGILLALAAAGWALIVWQAVVMDEAMAPRPTMGMGAMLFLAIWVAMMVAMMFPSAAPMVLTFAQVHTRKRSLGKPYVPTWIFVAAYLAIWTLLGMVAYVAAVGAEYVAGHSTWLTTYAAQVGGALLIIAGLYQVTPLKERCLHQCRSPLALVMSSWRDGRVGAFRMGIEHGTYCLGCCSMLFVILFPLGMMNIAVLAVITVLIFAEKTLPIGQQLRWIAAFALICYGALVLFYPSALPTVM